MKIVIIGATGFIGRNLLKLLVLKGHDVLVLSRDASNAKISLNYQNCSEWNSDANILANYINNTDVLINLAGESIAAQRWSEKRKKILVESRTKTIDAIVKAMSLCMIPPKTYVQASAVGIYPDSDTQIYTEDCETVPNNFITQLVTDWENAAKPATSFVNRLIILRTGLVLGKDGGVLDSFLPSFKMYAGSWLGSGRHAFPWIHIDDECEAILFLISNPESKGVYNLATPSFIDSKSFSKILGKVLHKPAWLPVPRFVLRLMFGKLTNEVLLANTGVYPQALLEDGYNFKFNDVEMALNNIIY